MSNADSVRIRYRNAEPCHLLTGSFVATVPKRVTMCQYLEQVSGHVATEKSRVERMDEKLLREVAHALRLELVLRLFPEDVAAAAAQVEAQRKTLQGVHSPADEPWPPMRVPDR